MVDLAPLRRGFFMRVLRAARNQRSGWALGWWACCVSEGPREPGMARHKMDPPSPAPLWRGFCLRAGCGFRHRTNCAARCFSRGFAASPASPCMMDNLAPLPGGAFSVAARCAVIWCRWVCLHATGANPRKELSPASAGFFRVSVSPCAVQPTVRLEVELAGLPTFLPPGETASPIERMKTQLSPAPRWGFLCVCCVRFQKPIR